MSQTLRASSASAAAVATPAAPVRRRILHAGSAGMLIAGLITVVGSVLPWVLTPVGSLAGTAGPGLWTLSAGFLAIAGALLPIRWVAVAHCLVPGFAVAAIVLWQLARLLYLSAATDSWGQLLPGIGMVMVAGGAVILLRTGYRLVTRASAVSEAPPTSPARSMSKPSGQAAGSDGL